MGLKISFDDKKFAKDDVMGIPGLAAVPNGGSVVVSDADLKAWEEARGIKIKDGLGEGSGFKFAEAPDPKPEEEVEAPAPNEAEKGKEVK